MTAPSNERVAKLIVERFSRFFRTYDISLHPRHKKAAALPLDAADGAYSIRDAFEERIKTEEGVDVQANGDTVELMDVEYQKAGKALILLFHRASPNAADPMYRKKAREKATNARKVTTRQAQRQAGEEPAVSAHLVIHDVRKSGDQFRAALEEVPGISMSSIGRILSTALGKYPFEYVEGKRNEKTKSTYTVFKTDGVKSETLDSALKKGEIDFVTLTRSPVAPIVDAEGIFQPTAETMRFRVVGEVDSESWTKKFNPFAKKARADGWTVSIDMVFEDKRKRTVFIEREEEAKEIVFVRSEQVSFDQALSPCSVEIHGEIVEKALGIIRASRKQ